MFSPYGLFIGISIVVFLNYFEKKHKYIPLALIIFAFLGARLYFVLAQLPYFLQNPSQILNTRVGGLGIFGGIIATIIYLLIFCKIKKIKFIKFTDSFITIIPLSQAIGRIGNIINHEIYPVCIYELFLDLIIYFILLKSKKNQTAIYIISYSLVRFILEFLRTDALPFYLGNLISLIGIIIGIILLNDQNLSRRRSHKKS